MGMKKSKKIITSIIATSIVLGTFIPVIAVQVEKKYTNNNRSYRYLSPQGIVLHSTANKGGTADENVSYFNREYVGANAHYFVDWTKAVAAVPEEEIAWHAGSTANSKYIGIEMCEPYGYNEEEFNNVYYNTVNLVADICARYGWDSSYIVSHKICSDTYGETDHDDPILFLSEYGVTWDEMIEDIQNAIDSRQIKDPVMAKAKKYLGDRCLELQQKLNKHGYELVEDGVYGEETHRALGEFQRSKGLVVDYIAGPKTWKELN